MKLKMSKFRIVRKPKKGDVVRPCNASSNHFDEIVDKVSFWFGDKITFKSGRWISISHFYQLQLHGTLEIVESSQLKD